MIHVRAKGQGHRSLRSKVIVETDIQTDGWTEPIALPVSLNYYTTVQYKIYTYIVTWVLAVTWRGHGAVEN